jgi:hypothetical protein
MDGIEVAGIIGVFIPIVAIIGGLLFTGVVVVTAQVTKAAERKAFYETARAAVEKGQPLPPEVIEAMAAQPKRPATAQSDLRAGMIWLAAGLGVIIFGFAIGFEDGDAVYPLMGLGAIPLLIGVAMILLSFFNPNKSPPK